MHNLQSWDLPESEEATLFEGEEAITCEADILRIMRRRSGRRGKGRGRGAISAREGIRGRDAIRAIVLQLG